MKGIVMPKKVACPGAGEKVAGEDDPGGYVGCKKCGASYLRMETRTNNGKAEHFVPKHDYTASPKARAKAKASSGSGVRGSNGRGPTRRR